MKKAIIILTLMIAIFAASVSGLNITLFWNSTSGEYETPGEYISATLDSVSPNVYYCELSWDEDTPANTDVDMQLRSGTSDPPSGSFVGPDGTSGTLYQTTPLWINSTHNSERYIQWESTLSTIDTSVTPTLRNVSITYATDGDDNSYDCNCVARIGGAFQSECLEGNVSCWDSSSAKCCGDDDDANDNFYIVGSGGCINRAGVGTADKTAPNLEYIVAPNTDYYYYSADNLTSGTVYFNSALAQGETITFNVNWTMKILILV